MRAFQAVTSQIYGKLTLWSCQINDESGVAIVLAEDVGADKVGVMPLFVAITPSMEITFEGEQAGSVGDRRGAAPQLRDQAGDRSVLTAAPVTASRAGAVTAPSARKIAVLVELSAPLCFAR